nr:WG repeat-containing protein [Chryseosolibacter indicus]
MVNEPWVAVKKNDYWQYVNYKLNQSYKRCDSLWFVGPFVVETSKDTITVVFNANVRHSFTQKITTSFIPGKDSSSYLIISQDKKKTLYNQRGNRLFSIECDNIQAAAKDHFIVWKKEKKGLINGEGKLVLPIEFDAIGSASNNEYATLLKSSRFGIYNFNTKKFIKPQYDKNLVVYNDHFLTAFQKGSYGFIDWENKPASPFTFNEVKYWGDTLAFVRQNDIWKFYNLYRRKTTGDNFREIKFVSELPDERVAIVYPDYGAGILSSKRGEIIRPSFNFISNVGSQEEPCYLTEKHVEEASVYIIMYYDKDGKMIMRKVYDDDDYEKVLCQ